MKNLQEKLNALYGRANDDRPDETAPSDIRMEMNRLLSNRIPIKHFPKAAVEKASLSLDKLVDGRWINTHFGDIFRGEFAFDLGEIYGNLDLAEIFRFSETDYQECFQISGIASPENFLFIDTETTGLAGGSGTVAFLVGLGWIDADKFIVHQYFITQLSHEEGMLELLNDVVNRFDCLVSFNGRTFDIPLLTTRFLMNRIEPPFESRHHIDLLYYTRLLWRLAMENCKLKTLETELLGLNREDDIPGEIIPEIYFEYLRTRNTEKLERIFYHNRFDIVSMLAGLILATQTMRKRTPESNPLVDFAKGKLFGRKKDAERRCAGVCRHGFDAVDRIVDLVAVTATNADRSVGILVDACGQFEHIPQTGDRQIFDILRLKMNGRGGFIGFDDRTLRDNRYNFAKIDCRRFHFNVDGCRPVDIHDNFFDGDAFVTHVSEHERVTARRDV